MELKMMIEKAKAELAQSLNQVEGGQTAATAKGLEPIFEQFGALAALKIADLIRVKTEKYPKWVMAAFEGDPEDASKRLTELLAINVKLSDISEIIGTGAIRKIEEHIKGGSRCPIVEVHDIQTMQAIADILG